MFKVTTMDAVRHHLNPLQIYSRLVSLAKFIGIGHRKVQKLCAVYERRFYRPVMDWVSGCHTGLNLTATKRRSV